MKRRKADLWLRGGKKKLIMLMQEKNMRGKSKENYKVTTIELSKETFEKLAAKAKEERTSRNKIINAALAQYLNR